MALRRSVPLRTGLVLLMVIVLLAGASAGVAQVWTRLRAIDYGYKISKATRLRSKLQEKNRRLRVELALLKSPARIADLAAQAGLRPPEPEQVRRIRVAPDQPSLAHEQPPKPQRRSRPIAGAAGPRPAPDTGSAGPARAFASTGPRRLGGERAMHR